MQGLSDDQARVDDEARTWAQWWQCRHEYPRLDFGGLGPPLPKLGVARIRSSARSFPTGTGLGADNLAPRAVARLSDAALLALIALFEAFEALGSWCQALDLVLIVLLPKSDGGLRPIGLLCTVIRIWMRAHSDLVRDWERAQAHLARTQAGNDDDSCNGGGLRFYDMIRKVFRP